MAKIAHCVGCYDPESCPGVDIRTAHCADCIFDDELELEIMAGVFDVYEQGADA